MYIEYIDTWFEQHALSQVIVICMLLMLTMKFIHSARDSCLLARMFATIGKHNNTDMTHTR